MLILAWQAGCVKSYPDAPFLAFLESQETYTVTVIVSGLTGTLVLRNGSDELTISADGNHTFSAEYPSGSLYEVVVQSQPAGQECTVSGGTGSLTGNIRSILVNCLAVGITGISLDRTYISGLGGGINVATLDFVPEYSGSYAIKYGTDCATGSNYSAATGPMTAGTPVSVTLDAVATTGLVEGPNNVIICAYEPGPVLGDEIFRSITVDNTAPVVSASPVSGNLSSAGSISLSCTDGLSGCNGMAYSEANVAAPAAFPDPADPTINNDGTGAVTFYSGPIAVADLRVITIEARAVDNAGNISTVVAFNYTVDASFSALSSPAATNPYVSSITGAKNTTVISWTSDRSNRPFSIRLSSTDCSNGTIILAGATGTGGHTTSPLAATLFTSGANAVRICEENYIGAAGSGTTLTITRDEVPPAITDFTGNGSYIPYNGIIEYRFSESIDSSTSIIANDVSTDANPLIWSNLSYTNDRLQIEPALGAYAVGQKIWRPGLSRGLTLTVYDLAGNSASVVHSYVMRDGTVEPYYASASNWNYYVKNDGTTIFDASDSACDGSEAAFYFGCIHGGEMRKIIVPDKIDDCTMATGPSATDGFSFFRWVCYDPPGAGPVQLVSLGLTSGISLGKLIDHAANSFLANSVTISNSAVPAAPAAVWWSNPIQDFPPGGGVAATAGEIFTVDVNTVQSAMFDIQASNVSVTMPDTVALRASGSFAMISNSGFSFSWIEGNYNGNYAGVTAAISLTGPSHYHRLHRVNVWNVDANPSGGGIYLREISDSYLSEIRVTNTLVGSGIAFYDNSGNTNRNLIRNASLYNNVFSGLKFVSGNNISDLIVMDSYITSNGSDGINFQGSGGLRNSVFMNLTVANSGEDSMDFQFSANVQALTFVNVLAINSGGYGIILNSGSADFQFMDMAFAINQTAQINMNNAGNNHYFSGILHIDGVNRCLNIGPGTGLDVVGSCVPEGLSDHTNNYTLIPYGGANGIILKMSAADPVNGSPLVQGYLTNGPAMDWPTFSYIWRNWGKSTVTPPPSNVRNRCSDDGAASCQQHDYALRTTAHPLRLVLACPAAAVSADIVIHNWATAPSTPVSFVRHAYEADTDNRLDLPFCLDDGEECVYTPNFGAYQGHGVLIDSGCADIGAGGFVQNVDLLEYDTNGF